MKQEQIELKKNFPASQRIFKQGEDADIQVPFRQIALSETVTEQGTTENEPFIVYDTAGPYHDDTYEVDVTKGIPALRTNWIEDRQDVEHYEEG